MGRRNTWSKAECTRLATHLRSAILIRQPIYSLGVGAGPIIAWQRGARNALKNPLTRMDLCIKQIRLLQRLARERVEKDRAFLAHVADRTDMYPPGSEYEREMTQRFSKLLRGNERDVVKADECVKKLLRLGLPTEVAELELFPNLPPDLE